MKPINTKDKCDFNKINTNLPINIFKKLYSDLIGEDGDIDKKLLYTISIFIAFGFYVLAYIFSYGYYFSGITNSKRFLFIPLIQIIINPVPFNFKSLIVLGVFLVFIIGVFMHISFKITAGLKNDRKMYLGDLIILLLIVVLTHASLMIIFVGKIMVSNELISMWFYLIFALFLCVFLSSGAWKNLVLGFFGALDIWLFIIIFNLERITAYNRLFVLFLILASWIVVAILSIKQGFKNSIYIASLHNTIFIMLVPLMSKFTNNLYITVSTSIIATLVVLPLARFIIKSLKEKTHTLVNIFQNSKTISSMRKVYSKFNIDTFCNIRPWLLSYKLLFISIIVFIYVQALTIWIYKLGEAIHGALPEQYYEEITCFYEDNTKETFKGTIVCHKDNVYYISTQDRKLVTIKNSTVKSIPKD